MIVDGVSGPLFWIDDVHVTGSVAGARVPRWDWVNSFLTTHAQYSEAVLRGGFYTPELVVAGDLSSAEIRIELETKVHTKVCYHGEGPYYVLGPSTG